MRPNRRVGSAAMLLLILGAVACLDTAAPLLDTPHSVAHVLVEPAQASVSVGDQYNFTATVLDQSGDPVTGQAIAWVSTDTSIAVVSNTGQVTTKRTGFTQIKATSSSQVGTASLTVVEASVATIQLSLAAASIAVGDTLQLSAVPRDDNGNALLDRTVSWTSANPGVASVSSNGTITGVAAGATQVTATSDGVSASAIVTISLPAVATVVVSPDTLPLLPQQAGQLTVTTRDAHGKVLSGQTVTWSSSDTTVAVVSATGMVTSRLEGSATITATSQKKSGKSKILVAQTPVAAVVVTPSSITLMTDSSAQLHATPKDQSGTNLSGEIISWTTSDNTIATVSSTGVVKGIAAGTAIVTATSEGKAGTTAVTVAAAPPTVASVSVTPTSDTVIVNATVTLTATPKDASGSALAGQLVTWSSGNTSIATVSSSGVVTGVAVGTTSVTATSSGKSGTANIRVALAPVASVVLSPSSANVPVGGAMQFTAATVDASGNPLTGRTVTWNSTDTTIAKVSSAGLMTAVGPGTALVVATSEGQKDSATVTAAPPPVATVSVTPTSASLLVGATQQLAATTKDATGKTLTGRTIAWSTSDSTIAAVSATGLVTAKAAGSATVTATSEGKSGTSNIAVTAPAVVASVAVSPGSATLQPSGTQQFTAVAKDSAGNTLSGRSITWSSANTVVATVSASGLATAIGAGTTTIVAMSGGKSGSASVTVTTGGSPPPATHGGWFVAPTGSSSGAGTQASPWNLTTALGGGNGKVQPGDTIWLRNGTYAGTFTSSLAGSASSPIIVRQYPGERATINGSLTVNGTNTWYWDFEIANTNANEQSVSGVSAFCPGCKYIDLVIHDHSSNGIGLWAAGSNAEVYGNIIYNNGFYGESVDHAAHGIYTQNTTGTKRIINNLLFNQFGFGIHVYGSETAPLNNYTIQGNAVVNSGIGSQTGMSGGFDYQIGGMSPLGNLVFTHNMSYRVPGDRSNTARLGYSWGPLNSGGVITDNYFVGDLMVSHWSSLTFQRNSVLHANNPALDLETVAGQTMPTGTWTNNSYMAASASDAFQMTDGTNSHEYNFADWQSTTGYDAGSSFTTTSPNSNVVVVQPDIYEQGRANIIIYNWAGQGSVAVDLSQVLQPGDHYEIHNAQNFYGPAVATGTYAGGMVTIPITSVTPAPSISSRGVPVPTGTEFNAYVVVKQ